jgi:two-component system, cell cycle sensor histidine kinase and response regulator CckA
MPDPLRVLYIGADGVDAVAAELDRGGYEPIFQNVGSKEELLAALNGGWDIAISDTVTGDCGALEALHAIQERGLDLPLIVVSGKIKDSEVLAALSAGAGDHLTRSNLMRLNAAVGRERRAANMRRDRVRLEEQFRQAQKMEAVGRLAGGIAHDFNNLLMVIQGYADLMTERLAEGDPLRRNAEQIQTASQRATSLTRQLLAFSRKQMLAPKVLSIQSVVTEMEKILRRLIGEDVQLETSSVVDLGLVKADRSQIEQVILNLAVNARDAMPEGGRLTIETANVDLDESFSHSSVMLSPGPYVMLAVTDNGCGMDVETQAHIFEPFFTTKEKGKGTGLGLATVYGIVKQSGGYVWVYSEPGRGTSFKVYLPRVWDEPTMPGRDRRIEGQRLPQGTETVLLVEDEKGVRELAREYLEMTGYTVIEAENGHTALELAALHSGPIHLLMTDVVMPGISGRELSERVRAIRPEIRVLFMSGYTDQAVVHHGILETDAVLLQKPFTVAALAAKLRDILNLEVAR